MLTCPQDRGQRDLILKHPREILRWRLICLPEPDCGSWKRPFYPHQRPFASPTHVAHTRLALFSLNNRQLMWKKKKKKARQFFWNQFAVRLLKRHFCPAAIEIGVVTRGQMTEKHKARRKVVCYQRRYCICAFNRMDPFTFWPTLHL